MGDEAQIGIYIKMYSNEIGCECVLDTCSSVNGPVTACFKHYCNEPCGSVKGEEFV
jgi:hypothetical protein